MEGINLFRKLTAFCKFDYKRFAADAEILKIHRANKDDQKSSFATFKPQHSKTAADKSINEDKDNNSDDEDDDDSIVEDNEITEDEDHPQDGDEELKKKKKKKKKKKTPEQLKELEQEELARIRNKFHIHTTGADVPPPLASFQQLHEEYGVSKTIIENIEAQGYTEPTGIQRQAWPLMIQGRDTMACAPTGSGKTAGFIVPMLHHLSAAKAEASEYSGPMGLILVPTRELAKQCVQEVKKLYKGLHLTTTLIEKEETVARKCKVKMDILVTTPNRLIYMLQQTPPLLSVSGLHWLVVDECDKLFEAGKSGFREQLGYIYTACANPKLHRGLFSATYAHDVEQWCRLNLDNVVQVTIGDKNIASRTVEQKLVFTGDEYGKLLAFRNLIKEGLTPPVLVFVQSKDRAKQLYQEMLYENIRIDVMHADRPQEQRDQVVKNFRLGITWVLVCTELMGRGIDFKGVNLVVNYDFPTSAVAYIHRVGRTGRAGKKGKAVTFFTEDDKDLLRSVAGMIRQAGCPVPEYMHSLKKPNKKNRRKLAQHVPERKGILTMHPEDQERLKRKRKIIHSKLKSKKKAKLDHKEESSEQNGTTKTKLQNGIKKIDQQQKNKQKKQKTEGKLKQQKENKKTLVTKQKIVKQSDKKKTLSKKAKAKSK